MCGHAVSHAGCDDGGNDRDAWKHVGRVVAVLGMTTATAAQP